VTPSPPTPVLSPADGDRLLDEIEDATNTDMPRAVALARQALDDGWEHPRILALVAFQFEEDGRYDDAMRLLDRAAGLDPSDVTVWHSVGMCLVKMERRRAAVNAF
jgi:Flp pilus assembly protein TadD